MKAREYMQQLRALDAPGLDDRLREARTELFNLRFQAATGQLENHRRIRSVRRQIAQVLMVMQVRLLGLEEQNTELAPAVESAPPRRRGRGATATAPEAAEVEPAGGDAAVATAEPESPEEPA